MTSIDEQAARWAVRLASEALPAEEQRQLERWLQSDLRHRGALIRARAHWVELDRLAALHGPVTVEPPPATAHRPQADADFAIGGSAKGTGCSGRCTATQ